MTQSWAVANCGKQVHNSHVRKTHGTGDQLCWLVKTHSLSSCFVFYGLMGAAHPEAAEGNDLSCSQLLYAFCTPGSLASHTALAQS